MKFIVLCVGLSISAMALAQELKTPESEVSALRDQQEKILEDYKKANKDWGKLPNDEYQQFYTEWSNKSLSDELELRKGQCEKDTKACLADKEREALEAQTRVAIKVVELRNEFSKSNPNKEEQAKLNADIERAANINLCQQHATNCEKLAKKDLALVEQLKRRDARIEGMEAEFSSRKPDWKEQKGDKEVKDFVVRRENELLNLNLKLNDTLCHDYPKDKEFCFDEGQLKELALDTARMNCQHERVHQLYNMAKDEIAAKEKILLAGHYAQWESLENKDCKYLIAQDRLGESLAPAPAPIVIAAPVKEEVYGDNEDEKNIKNFKPETCRWVTDLPRKISYMPGCGSRGACIGYVVCDRKEGEGKFVRTSTCAPQNCGSSDEDAVRCTKQGGYYTKKAKDETKEFVSEKLKRIFSGAIKQ